MGLPFPMGQTCFSVFSCRDKRLKSQHWLNGLCLNTTTAHCKFVFNISLNKIHKIWEEMKIKQIMFHHEIFLFDVALFNLIWVQIDKKVKWNLSHMKIPLFCHSHVFGLTISDYLKGSLNIQIITITLIITDISSEIFFIESFSRRLSDLSPVSNFKFHCFYVITHFNFLFLVY